MKKVATAHINRQNFSLFIMALLFGIQNETTAVKLLSEKIPILIKQLLKDIPDGDEKTSLIKEFA